MQLAVLSRSAKRLLWLLPPAVVILFILYKPTPQTSFTETPATSPAKNITPVELAFEDQKGRVMIQATLSGRKKKALIDTGAPYLCWNQDWNLPGRATGLTVNLTNVLYGKSTAFEVILDRLDVGGIVWQNIPGFAEQVSPRYKKFENYALLGCDVLKYQVLKIDYKTKRVSLYPEDYNPEADYRSKSTVVDLHWTDDPIYVAKAIAYVNGEIEGHPAKFCLDTGALENSTLLSEKWAKKHIKASRIEPVKLIAPGLVAKKKAIFDLKWSIAPSVKKKSEAVLFSLPHDGVDVVVGTGYFKEKILLFDFPRKKLYLVNREPSTKLATDRSN